MVVIRFQDLPPKPWPLTVAGLPAVFTTQEYSVGFEYGRLGGSRKKALHDYDAREHVTEELFSAAIAYFEQELSIPILSILNLAGAWVVVVPDDVQISSLPPLLARTTCHYKYASAAAIAGEHKHKRKEEAPPFRNTEHPPCPPPGPAGGTVWDQTSYSYRALQQPGIMLSSGREGGENERLSTSGVVVRDDHGSRYFILVARPGFPPLERGESIYYSNANANANVNNGGVLLGRVHDDDRLPDTNTGIALCRISSSSTQEEEEEEEEEISNETFGARLSDDTTSTTNNTTILPQKITGIRDPFSIRKYDEVTMYNPFSSGYCIVGVHIGVQLSRVLVSSDDDPVVDRHSWVTNEWSYWGNGRDDDDDEPTMDGGSPVLDEDGKVVSFFRGLMSSSGFAVGVAASMLESWGYTLV